MKKFARLMLSAFTFLFTISVYAAAPAITGVTTADPATYDNGDTISFSVQFDQIVNVVGGSPDLKFRSPDNLSKSSGYVSGTGTTTLVFDYVVGTDPNLNDWDGIELENSSGNPANLVMNGATIQNAGGEDANVLVPVTNFAGIKIDSKAPTWDKFEISSTAGGVSGNTRYLPGGSSVLTKAYLTENDTRSTAAIGLKAGSGGTQTIYYTGSNVNGRDLDAQKTGSLTGDGAVVLASYVWIDQAGKNATGGVSFIIDDADPGVTSYVMDSTPPVIDMNTDDVEVGPVASDNISIARGDSNGLDISMNKYGFVANPADCDDATDTTIIGDPGIISDELNNGQYVCAMAADFAGNQSFVASANPLNIDVSAPNFAGISVVSNNPYDNSYGKADSTLTFTLTLTNPDSYDGNGQIDFTIGGIPNSVNFLEAASSAKSTTYTATLDLSTVAPANNAAINITNINFADFLGQPMTGFVAGPPAPTVIVDTQMPSLFFASVSTNGAAGIWAKNGETITFNLGFDEEIIRGILNSASAATNVSTLTQEFDISAWGTSDDIVFTVQNGDNGVVTMSNADFTIIDHAGNSATISAGDINFLIVQTITADTTKPTASNIVITSNNALDNKLAKTNDTIRIDFITADNLSTNVTLKNTNPTYSYILGTGHGFSNHNVAGIGAGQFVERFTDGTETSEVQTSFRFVIRDEAGNKKVYKQNDLTGSNVKFDRTNPIIQEVKISATSVDGTAFLGDIPTYYAKQGDTLDLELQVCDYVDSENNPPTGTILGQAVTMTDVGQTGTACTTPEGNPSIWRKWSAQLLGIDGTEGLVTFSLDVNDNAGNVLVNVTGTTDGSSVIFDKTVPLNPTDVLDSLGAETLPFKHRSNAQFVWTNDADDTTNSAIVSGIKDYNIRLANIDGDHRNERLNSRNFDGRNSNLTGGLIPPHDIGNPYELYIQTRDKAGNDALEEISYTQPYTIGFVGLVTDENENPLSGVIVQVVSRYGETCNLNREVCAGTTDSNGEYIVLAQKDQDYNLTFFHPNYYLDKQEENLGHDDDKVVDSVLNNLNSVHESQTANQGVVITTSELFVREDGQNIATEIYVYSLSGEITHTEVGGKITVSSLSRITLVRSNNPAISIQNNGNNTYTISGAGNVLNTHSLENLESSASGISAWGTSANYSSGDARIGTKYIPSNGNPKNTFGKYTTPAEWKAFGERLRVGVAPQVLTYINRNGFEVFRGYRKGLLGWDRFEKRFQNDISYRGSYDRKFELEIAEDKEEVVSFAEKIKVMKGDFQNQVDGPVEKEEQFLAQLETIKPLARRTNDDAYKGILLRKSQKQVNKWERKSSFGKRVVKNPYERNLKVIKIQFANGTSAKIERVIR